MGWFEEQIKTRQKNDNEALSDAYAKIAASVLGSKALKNVNDKYYQTKNELDRILRYFHIKTNDIPKDIDSFEGKLEYLMHPKGIMHRNVELNLKWYKQSFGPLICFAKEDNTPVAMLPSLMGGYYFYDKNNKKRRLNKKQSLRFKDRGICFYKPFPNKVIKSNQLLKIIFGCLSASDYIVFSLATVLLTALGMFGPILNQKIFTDVIASGDIKIVISMLIFLVCVSLSTAVVTIVKSLIRARIEIKLSYQMEAATMMRIISLPAHFFKNYSSGELASRSRYVAILCETIVSTLLSIGLTTVFSISYIAQVFIYAPSLALPAILIVVINALFSVIVALIQKGVLRKQIERTSSLDGLEYSLISGIQKIKLSGSENRAFAKWGNEYAEETALIYNPPLIIKLNTVISTLIALGGDALIYFLAVKKGVTVANYYAFDTAYALISASFISLTAATLVIARVKPMLEMVKPIFETVPETIEVDNKMRKINGSIEVNNLFFKYTDESPNIFNGLSFKIRAGEYVAIVGETGCGKSTLLRLLLGFEKPQKGGIFLDRRDISKVNMRSLRHAFGVVLQDSKLFEGDIFTNITISSPNATMEDAWKVAETVDMAESIRKMPMKMHTLITEGSGGLSGGQKQRLMIARAIIHNPNILLLDEATSALDNISQKTISDALGKIKCTRIVIAHRLSTIKECDRILVLQNGSIVEEGKYEDLISRNGVFTELVERQRVEDE